MLERMQKVYTDISYEDTEIARIYKNNEKKVNVNACSLVIVCINKLYQIMLEFGYQLATS